MKRQFDFKRALQTFEKNPNRPSPLTDADIKHLRRWSEDPRCEELWQRLSGPLFARPGGEVWYSIAVRLIDVVIAIRNEVEGREKLEAAKKSTAEPRKAALSPRRSARGNHVKPRRYSIAGQLVAGSCCSDEITNQCHHQFVRRHFGPPSSAR